VFYDDCGTFAYRKEFVRAKKEVTGEFALEVSIKVPELMGGSNDCNEDIR
jgi:hypothetical protein